VDDRNAPASKGDIADLRSELKVDLEQFRAEVRGNFEQFRAEVKQNAEQLRAEVNHGYNDIVERIHDSQTELLKAFYGYAQGNNKRVAELEGNEGAFRSRLATIEDRILEVERRLNTPPSV
jgi:uncharacterized protein involved in exopolysaccharide biosynthesis